METTIDEYNINNQALLLGGITSLIFGVMLLTWTGATLTVITLLIGLWWLIQGLFLILGIFQNRSQWIWKLLSGVIGVLAGILVLQHPLQSALILPATLVFILGIMGIVIGITSLIAAFGGEGWGIGAFGIISIIIGVTLATNVIVGAQFLLWITAGLLILEGVVAIYMAYK
ncbi:MAG: DUF308 domain-containing protein [Methanolobus sp.]|uniref:HdeD family acid-resistance protein n=1 Tax=Methanolobus sp. TaxID=1874737 RepID=UPI0027309EA1|nr:DUF308 domain-containing protein [Methanolobus sp.]MDP2217666.1 DUF308 domain-containing protein [Methanolobus sp.]